MAVLAGLWLLGRVACLFSAMIPAGLVIAADLAFAVALDVVAARELIAVGNRRNYPLLAPVIVLAIANLLTHLQALGVAVPIGLGWRLGIAVVIVLISVIGGRIVPAFTSNWLGARGLTPVPPSIAWLEIAARGTLIAAMLGWVFLPDWRPLGVLLLVAAALNLVRLARWRGIATLEEPLLLVLHVGYLWLVIGVALAGAVVDQRRRSARRRGARADRRRDGHDDLAVMTRATLGHTGRVLRADKVTMLIYALASASALLRIAAAWVIDGQMDLYDVAALAWVGAFALFAAEYGPMLLAARR